VMVHDGKNYATLQEGPGTVIDRFDV